MKRIIYLILTLILIISSCSIGQNGSGYVTINTPEIISPPVKSVINNGNTIDPLYAQSFLRYVLIIETKDGKRIKSEYLKTNEEKAIEVPAGIPLNFFIGVYIAESENSFGERFNTFVLSDKKENVVLMEGETKLIEFNLDLTKSTKVKSYYGDIFTNKVSHLYSVLNAARNALGIIYFTILPLTPKSIPDRTTIVTHNGSNFETLELSSDLLYQLGGNYVKMIKVNNDINDRVLWLLGKNKILRLSSVNDIATAPQINSDLFTSNPYLLKSRKIISLYLPKQGSEPRDRYYYFIDYGEGFLGFNWGLDDALFSSVENIKMDFTSNKVRQYSLLLDMKQDIDTSNTFVVTKIGTFYAKEEGLAAFSQGDYIKGVNSFKKIISISEDKTSNPILITSVIPTQKRNYIGTRKGLYYIDKNNSYWRDFVNADTDKMIILAQKALTKIDDVNEEIIDNMFVLNINGNEVLVVTTPKRILFKNMSNGKVDYLTLNDGLLFVPIGRLLNIVDTNDVDFVNHTIAPVVDIVTSGSISDPIWIATRFGLSSIMPEQLKIW